MENKLEVHFIVDAENKGSFEAKAHINGLEARVAALALLDNMAGEFSRDSIGKAEFLKTVHDATENLILKTLLNA